MPANARFTFQPIHKELGNAGHMPYIPLKLQYQQRQEAVWGLLDTGATVNVLPYTIGRQLGAVWEQQTIHLQLGGNLANWEARAMILSAVIADFDLVRLTFAWTRNDDVPLILGQTNFFMAFDVRFYRRDMAMEISPR